MFRQDPTIPGSAQLDVDILGIKPGMTPDEVRPIVRSRKLQNYLELTQDLAYPDPVTRVSVSLPNGNMLTFILSATGNRSSGSAGSLNANFESLSAAFTPVPGAERLVHIRHRVGLTNDKALQEDNFYNALIQKYGTPVWVRRRNQIALWLFGKHANRTGSNIYAEQPTCTTFGSFSPIVDGVTKDMRVVQAEAVGGNADANLLMRLPGGASYFAKEAIDCGDVILEVRWGGPNPTLPDSERLVTEYDISLLSPPIAAEGLSKANMLATEMVRKAQKNVLDRASDQKKPDL